MLLPFMLLILIGMAVVTGALNQDRKISRIAISVTDLIAQAQTVNTSDLDSVMKVGDAILAPYTTDDLDIVVASVSFDDKGKATVDWSRNNEKSTASDWKPGSEPPITLPETIAKPNSSIVVGYTNLAYRPLFAELYSQLASVYKGDAIQTINLSDTYYLRPRLTARVDCEDCPGS
ncbi:pilus assembly protein [Rhodobacterales bacterium]|nr:pilus assembly protein [Rhodobacterales bacterium]